MRNPTCDTVGAVGLDGLRSLHAGMSVACEGIATTRYIAGQKTVGVIVSRNCACAGFGSCTELA